jgi:hypothetical protein
MHPGFFTIRRDGYFEAGVGLIAGAVVFVW